MSRKTSRPRKRFVIIAFFKEKHQLVSRGKRALTSPFTAEKDLVRSYMKGITSYSVLESRHRIYKGYIDKDKSQ